ncbi:MAG: glycosyltransferase [Planctomycetota bacterium]
MKVAYIVGTYPTPSERFIEREVRALGELGVEVTVYPLACGAGVACPWCVLGRHVWLGMLPRTWRAIRRFPAGKLAGLSFTAWREFPGGLDRAARVARDVEGRAIEHVHAHFATKPAAVGLMVAAMTGLPFTLSAHARDVFVDGVALAQKVGAARRVAVCSRAARDALEERIPAALHGRLQVVRHGLDASRFEFAADRPVHEPVRVLAAGRFVEKKGFDVLIDAMVELDDCACELAGSGPLEGSLRRQVDRLGLADRVTFPGWLPPDEVRERMVNSDVLVVPSRVARDGDRDGVPNVLLEAAAVGLPIVACDAGGIDEFVHNAETGRLVPPTDPELVAGAVRSVLSTPETTRRFARAARKKLENEYDLRDNVRLLMESVLRPGPSDP